MVSHPVRYSFGEKLHHHKQLSTLSTILLVATERHEIEVWSRQKEGDEWNRALV